MMNDTERRNRPPEKIAGKSPVTWGIPQPRLVAEFSEVLQEAQDEGPLQRFFETSPIALLTGLLRPHTAWVIPHPRFGKPDFTGWVPDFILCDWSSLGPQWLIVELESPRRNPATSKGLSATCNHAVQQINDYRTYLRENSAFLREGFGNIHCECQGIVVIGRRSDRHRETQKARLEALRRQEIEIMSYDRLLNECQLMQDAVAGLSGSGED
jgi:hypothetical protein